MVSNCIGVNPVGTVWRLSKTERNIVDITTPGMSLKYNYSMGGTDVINHVFSCNRPGIRSKECWFLLLTFCLQSSLHNSYLIYQKSPGTGTAYLDFPRSVVQNYLSNGKSIKIPRGQMFYVKKWVENRVSKQLEIKFPTLLKILKKEQVLLFVINQVLCINVLNAICMCTGNASQPFTTVYKVILTFLIVFLKKFIHVSV